MPSCDTKKEPAHMIALLFVSVSLGAVFSLVFSVKFALKWRQFDEHTKRKSIPRLSAITAALLVFERVLRIIECVLWFTASVMTVDILYNINNFISLTGIFGSLSVILIKRLKLTFRESAYQVSEQEFRLLYSLTAVDIVSGYVCWTLNGIPGVTSHVAGRVVLIVFACSFLLSCSLFLIRVDLAFVSRLRLVVAMQAVNDEHESVPCDSPAALNTDDTQQLPDHNPNQISKVSTIISDIRRATLSSFPSKNNAKLLSLGSKSTTIAIWITLAVLLLFISAILFVFSDCAQWSTVMGHLMIAGADLITAAAVFVSLPDSQDTYQEYCRKVDRWVVKVVAYKTSQQVNQIRKKTSEIH